MREERKHRERRRQICGRLNVSAVCIHTLCMRVGSLKSFLDDQGGRTDHIAFFCTEVTFFFFFFWAVLRYSPNFGLD